MNESRKKGLLRLRHLSEVTEARGEEMEEQGERFARLADPSAAPRIIQASQLFQTPEPLAARLAGMFPSFGRTLEPSAGLGRLYRAVRAVSDCPMVLVDVSPECCGELYRASEGDGNARLVRGDFLTMNAERLGGLFDCCIMNSPFAPNAADIRHIRHAVSFLKPNGRLVAICMNGPRQRKQLKPLASEWVELPANSFAESGTGVNAAIIIIDKATN